MKKLFFLMSLVIMMITAQQSFAGTHTESICSGDSIEIGYEAPNGYMYIWNTIPLQVQFTKVQFIKPIWVKPTIETMYSVSVWDQFQKPLGIDTFIVKVKPAPNLFISLNPGQIICLGKSVTLTASGGNHYVWSPGIINGTPFIPNITTTYTVTATGTNGCTAVAKTVIIVNPLPKASAGPDKTVCNGQSVTLSATGGTTYAWNIGQSESGNSITVTPSTTTTYTVTVTDATGCSAMANVIVTVNPLPKVTLTGKLGSVCNNTTPFIPTTGNPIGGTWAGLGVSQGKIYPESLTPGIYPLTYTYKDGNGCSASQIDTLTIKSVPTLNLTATPGTICSGASTNVSAATDGNMFLWNTGNITQTITVSPLVTTTYYVTVTGTNACTHSGNIIVNVNPLPSVSLTLTEANLCTEPGVKSTIPSGGLPLGGTYSGSCIFNGKIYPSVVGVGTYIVTYTYIDVNGCSNTATDLLTINPIPAVIFNNISGMIYTHTFPFDLTNYVSPMGGTFSGKGVIGTMFDPATAGVGMHMITYTYTHPISGCSASQIQYITVGSAVGVDEVTLAVNAIRIFPNPADNNLNVGEVDIKEIKTLKIINLIGKVMYISESRSDMNIDVSGYPSGLYVISFINTEGISISKRFMKQ